MTLDSIHRNVAGPAGALFVDDGAQGGTPVVFVHSFAGNTATGKPSCRTCGRSAAPWRWIGAAMGSPPREQPRLRHTEPRRRHCAFDQAIDGFLARIDGVAARSARAA